jgi:hypothetical protein
MIDAVLLLLRDQLNDHLHAQSTAGNGDSVEDFVVLVDGEKMDPIVFKSGAVSALIVNIEEDATIRAADPFRRTLANGAKVPIAPEIRLNLSVLFVARYRRYEQGLARLSSIIQYFQNHRVLDHTNAPRLSSRIEKLAIELVTLPFSEQNEIWGTLRTAYHPSVLYRVRLVTVAEPDPLPGPEVVEVVARVTQ